MKTFLYEVILYYVVNFSSNKRKLIEYLYLIIASLIILISIYFYNKNYLENLLTLGNFIVSSISILFNTIFDYVKNHVNNLGKLLLIGAFLIFFIVILFYLIFDYIKIYLDKFERFYFFYKFLLLNLVSYSKKWKFRNFIFSILPLFFVCFLSLINIIIYFFTKDLFFIWIVLFYNLGNPLLYILVFLFYEKLTFPKGNFITIKNFREILNLDSINKAKRDFSEKLFRYRDERINIVIHQTINDYYSNSILIKIIKLVLIKLSKYYCVSKIKNKNIEKSNLFIFCYTLTTYYILFNIISEIIFRKMFILQSSLFCPHYINIIILIILLFISIFWLSIIIRIIEAFYPIILLKSLTYLIPKNFLENLDIYYFTKYNKKLKINPYELIRLKNNYNQLDKYLKDVLIITIITLCFVVFQIRI